jgi:hypothetical protein
MTALVPVTSEPLLAYLASCGGTDRFEFSDGFGEPDPLAARRFAEDLRDRLGEALDSVVLVQQSANRVTVTAVCG